jgi:DNA-binding LytR/AlgR family response regulator
MIVDDEPLAVNLLEEYISRLPYLSLQHKSYNVLEALAYLKSEKVDLLFLDINMPHLSGMQMTTLLPKGQAVIFTTAYSEFAVESYEKNALDYLLKPITLDRFLVAVQKARQVLTAGPMYDTVDDQLYLKTGKTIIRIRYEDVWFVEGLKDYVLFYTTSGKHIVYKRMKQLEEGLPSRFSRVHNSYIINRDHIQRIGDNQVWIRDHAIPISDKYRESFFLRVNHHLL